VTDDDDVTAREADQIETVDLLGHAAREQRDRELDSAERAELIERTRALGTVEGTGLRIGRYQLLELVGAGGMGVVWGAWDPQLERRVALKLVQRMSPAAQERILREGQVLARLSHPNVVPIFDVGVAGEQVYLVMEWVRGRTLRAFAADKPGWRAVVDAYRQAAAGLDAAHKAGVIHRDFKPDNVISGDDGRVRVLDFGLAQAQEGDPFRSGEPFMGTPRYRSPEHLRGEAHTEASDQYAFCLSLREALEQNGGAPAWITAVVARGTDPAAARRFPSMRELLAALDRDPARRRVRVALGAAGVVAAGAAFAIGSIVNDGDGTRPIDPCSGGAAQLAATWSPAVRERAAANMRALGKIDETEVARVTGGLDGYAERWLGVHRDACLAHARHELTDVLYEQRLVCLAKTRAQLATVGEVLATVDGAGLPHAIGAAVALPDVTACAEPVGLVAPPPAALAARVADLTARAERALVLTEAHRPGTLDVTAEVVAEARAIGYAPLLARALMIQGRAQLDAYRSADGVRSLEESWRLALASSDDVLAVESYARWTFGRAIQGDTDIEGFPMMEELANRLGRPGRFARVLLYNNRAIVHLVTSDKIRTRALLERGAREAGDAPEPELFAIHLNLANLERDRMRCLAAHRAVLERNRNAYGANHPRTLTSRMAVALLDPDLQQAMIEARAIAIAWATWNPIDSAVYDNEIAWILDEGGDVAGAIAQMRHAVQYAQSPEERQAAAAYIAVRTGAADATALVDKLLRIHADSPPDHFYEHSGAGDAFATAALDAERRGDRAAAAKRWLTALGHYVAGDQAYYDRKIARVRRELERLGALP
jgi:eukaryotic-like serine/threonine-protein kinase